MKRLILGLFFLAMAFPALAERRVALVIGNSDYENAAKLKNPSNDAQDISSVLRELGFEVVEGRDLDSEGMRRTVKKFADTLPGADVALFFYAGHAVQVNGQNYLAPIDTDLKKESDLDFETVSLDLVRRQMEREATTQLVFLDACRDNPLTRSFSQKSRSTGDSQGLARLETSAEGTFIAFATQPDNVALDGKGRNSPFTAALLNNIRRPGIEISALMTDVRREVYDATEQQQLPWTNSSLLGSFFFKPGEPEKTDEQPTAEERERAERLEKLAKEADAFEAVQDSKDIAALEKFLREHPASIYEPLVRQAIERLKPKQEQVAAVQPKQEPDRPAAAPAETQPAAQAKPAEEPLGREAVRSIQQELARAGCNPGRPDGLWGANSRRALKDFASNARLDLASLEPEKDLLDRLKQHPGSICPASAAPKATVSKPDPEPARKKTVSRPDPAPKKTVSKPAPAPKKTAQAAPRPRKPSAATACFRFNGQLICD